MHTFEQVPARPLGAPTTVERPTVHTGGHEADDVRFHANPRWTELDPAGPAASSESIANVRKHQPGRLVMMRGFGAPSAYRRGLTPQLRRLRQSQSHRRAASASLTSLCLAGQLRSRPALMR